MNCFTCTLWVVAVHFAVSGARAAGGPASQPLAQEQAAHSVAFFERIMVQDYARVGSRSPKWDTPAREALDAMVRLWAVEFTPTNDEHDVIWHAVKKARQAGCDDPLVRLAQARNYVAFNRRYDETARLHAEAAEMLEKSGYHPLLKCYGHLRAAEQTSIAKQEVDAAKKQAVQMLDAATAHLPAVLADPTVPRLAVWELFAALGDASRAATGSRETYAARAFDMFDKASKDRSMVLAVMADFYTSFAWDARGPGFADDITPDEAEGMAKRLTEAQTAAEAAWEQDNGNVFAARSMMRIELGQGEGRPRFEQWFDRATKADPDNHEARHAKLVYLEPKWHGSAEDMIAFGRECAKTGNFDAGLPLLLPLAHERVARYGESEYHAEPQHAYFKDPKVWAEIKSVYDEYVRRVPDSLFHRSRYATFACWAEDWKTADEQFRAMGKRFSFVHFRNETRYKQQLAEVRKHIPEKVGAKPPAAD